MENDGMPPFSNRGAGNTYLPPLNAVVDWFQGTLKMVKSVEEILPLFPFENVQFLDCNGHYGYKKGLTNNGVFIFYDGSENMGIHLQITGTGCRYLEQFDNFNWIDFFNSFHSYKEYNVSRIDIALDDYKGIFSIPEIIKKVKRNELQSRFHTASRIESIQINGGESKGNTIYFGHQTSRLRIRMYEKNHERTSKGVNHNYKVWNRTEIQLRKERAAVLFTILLNKSDNDFSTEIKGILTYYLRFLKRSTQQNKSRIDTWHKWKKFIDEVEKIKLTESEPEKDLIDSYMWVEKQVSSTLAMLDYVGIDINDIIKNGKTKLRDVHIKKINDFIKKESSQKVNP